MEPILFILHDRKGSIVMFGKLMYGFKRYETVLAAVQNMRWYSTSAGYFVDEAACEAFDQAFTPKEKLRLPGQLW